MRFILCFMFLIAACNGQDAKVGVKQNFSIQSNQEITNIDAFSSQILFSLKKNSYNEFDRLMVPKELFLDYMRKTNEFDEQEAKDSEKVSGAYTFFKTMGLSNFERISNKLKGEGFNRNAIQYVSSSHNEASNNYKLTFTDGQQQYVFTSKDCAKIKDSFYLGNVNSVEKK